jgi:hypothetical protein
MIHEHIPRDLFEKTTSSLEKKFDKRFERLNDKIDAKLSDMKIQIKTPNCPFKEIDKISLWKRFNTYINSMMLKIKNFTTGIFRKK